MCKAWDDHIERGRKEGRTEGRREVLISLVSDGLLALSEAAKRANLSEDEFQAML